MVNANEALHVAQHLRALGLGEVRNTRILHRGAYLLVQLQTQEHALLVRLGPKTGALGARAEQHLLLTLAAHGLGVPHLLGRGRRGGRGLSGLPVWVFYAVAGRELAPFEASAGHAEAVGHYLASVHRVGRDLPLQTLGPPGAAGVGADPAVQAAMRRLEALPARHPLAATAAALLVAHARHRLQPRSRLPLGLVVGPLGPPQLRFVGPQLLGAIDFARARRGAQLGDLADALLAWGFVGDVLHPGRLLALARAYAARRPLLRQEAQALWHLCCLRLAEAAMLQLVRYELDGAAPRAHQAHKDGPAVAAAAGRTAGVALVRETVHTRGGEPRGWAPVQGSSPMFRPGEQGRLLERYVDHRHACRRLVALEAAGADVVGP